MKLRQVVALGAHEYRVSRARRVMEVDANRMTVVDEVIQRATRIREPQRGQVCPYCAADVNRRLLLPRVARGISGIELTPMRSALIRPGRLPLGRKRRGASGRRDRQPRHDPLGSHRTPPIRWRLLGPLAADWSEPGPLPQGKAPRRPARQSLALRRA